MSQNRLQGLKTYALVHASERPDERARLDTIHETMTAYFDGKLTLAPIDSDSPRSILEMGAGSGAWTVHAATTFPKAEILAVDLAEIPRTLPKNVRFHMADLTHPFDFQPDQFDLVHGRLFFSSLPNYKTILDRTFGLVKPGGWLIIEDVDNGIYEDNSELGPGFLLKAITAWSEVLNERDINTRAAKTFEALLRQSGMFSEVNVHKFSAPVSGQTDVPDLISRQFGSTARSSLTSIQSQAPARLSDPRLTQEMVEKGIEELNDRSRKIKIDFYFIWARKRL